MIVSNGFSLIYLSVPMTPFLDHVKEAWNLRHHPNMLFLFYEEITKVRHAIR